MKRSNNYFDQYGYVYSLNNNNAAVKNLYLRCKNSAGVHQCKARANAKSNDLGLGKLTSLHTHLPKKRVLGKTKFDKELDEACKKNHTLNRRDIYFAAREDVPVQEVEFIPLRTNYGSFIHRRKAKFTPKHPKTIEEFEQLIDDPQFKQKYCFDSRNNIFYRGVWTDENGHKMVVFISETAVKVLQNLKSLNC